MPWHVEKRDGRFCVIKNDDGANQGCHESREKAERQMAALYAQEGTMATDRNPRAFTAAAAEGLGEDRRQWIEVMPTAENAQNGRSKFTVTPADLEVLAERIRERGDQIPIDYDHSYQEGKGTKSAGWFTGQAEVRQTAQGPRLWAEVEWTPAAAESLANREYRFISAEWEMADLDKKSGLLTKAKDFLAATLTNRPFFQELSAVASEHPDPFFLDEPQIDAARARLGDAAYEALFAAANSADDSARDLARATLTNSEKETPMSDDMKAIAAELGLGEDATDEEILAAVKSAKEAAAAAAKKPATKKGTAMSGNLKAVAESLGLDPESDAATVIASLNQTIEAASKAESYEEENTRLTAEAARTRQLEEDVKILKAERNLERVQNMLAEGVRTGKVIPSEKTVLAKQFAANIEGLQELLDSRAPGVFSLAARGSGDNIEDEPEEVRTVITSFDSDHADGVDTDSARLHARAMQSLRGKGKTNPTEDEYLQELELVSAA